LNRADPRIFSGSPSADTGTDAPVPLPNVPSKILTKVIEYATFHTEQDKKEGDKKEEDTSFDSEFVKVDQATLFELILVRLAKPPTLTSSLLTAPFVASEKSKISR